MDHFKPGFLQVGRFFAQHIANCVSLVSTVYLQFNQNLIAICRDCIFLVFSVVVSFYIDIQCMLVLY